MTGPGGKPGDPDRHAELLRGMVRCAGADLSGRVVDGRLDRAAMGTYLGRCRQCPHANSCAAWLADHEGEHAPPPPYCLNRDRFGDLGGLT